ncbi:hypothetical protein V2J09_016965 [Rumex salicifolius]
MPEEDLVDVKFRLYDGSDIGPFQYSSVSTVQMLKERIISEWPKGKSVVPKLASEIKLISFGKILENNKTVGQCKTTIAELAGGVMVMHVVVQLSQAKTKTGAFQEMKKPVKNRIKLCAKAVEGSSAKPSRSTAVKGIAEAELI